MAVQLVDSNRAFATSRSPAATTVFRYAPLAAPKAILAAPNVSGFRTVEGDGRHWRGPIHLFQAG